MVKILDSPAEVVIFNPPPLMGGVRGNVVDLSSTPDIYGF